MVHDFFHMKEMLLNVIVCLIECDIVLCSILVCYALQAQ
jgi:hypothetical protein